MKIIYEDQDLIVLEKKAGMAIQTKSLTQLDLVSELRTYLKGGYVGVVHRLDQPVSGIIVFAKNQKAAAELSKQFANGTPHKEYTAIVSSLTPLTIGENHELTDYLTKDSKASKALVVPAGTKDAKKALLSYEVIRELAPCIYELKVTLFTGRFHQIRAQLSNAGLPILGDTKYDGKPLNEYTKTGLLKPLPRGAVALKAGSLSFIHPSTKEALQFRI